MPISQTQGQFNTGRDCSLVLIHAILGRFDLPNVTGFNSAQETSTIRIPRLDGVKMNAELPQGWTGQFDLERGSSGVDDFIAQMESLWIDQGTYGTCTLYQYVTENSSGGTSTYQYDNVAIKLNDAGRYQSDASVKQSLSFMANRRRKV